MAKAALNTDPHWRQRSPAWIDEDTGLQMAMGPFYVAERQGTWSVERGDKNAFGDNVAGQFISIFDAHAAMSVHYRAWFAERPDPVVYFIGTYLDPWKGRVKIGFTRALRQRLATLQTGSPEKLTVFATVPGTRHDEQRYHQRWKNYRLQGEWFRPCELIQKEIGRLSRASDGRA